MGKFVELSISQVSNLAANLLVRRLPKSSSLLNIAILYVNTSLNKNELVPTKIYAFDGNIDGDEAFVVAKQDRIKSGNFFLWTVSAPVSYHAAGISDISESLELIVDWTFSNSFTATESNISWDVAQKICEKAGQVRQYGPYVQYWMDNQFARQIDLNRSAENNIIVKDLDKPGMEALIKYWEYAQDGSFNEVLYSSTICASAGVSVNNELVSWGYASTDGAIHALHTLEEHRSKGYGKIVLQSLAKSLGIRGMYPTTQVWHANFSSAKLMANTGFMESHRVSWIARESV